MVQFVLILRSFIGWYRTLWIFMSNGTSEAEWSLSVSFSDLISECWV